MTNIRFIHDFPDFTVSSSGVFRNARTGTTLKLSKSAAGTWKVNFRIENRIYCRSAAKIVCTMFHGRPKKSEVVYYKDGNPDNIDSHNLEWKPKWFVLENNRQARRTRALRSGRVYMESTGQSFDNALVAAKELGLIEKYILLAIEQGNGVYGGSMWSWAGNR